jgi:hypothetical protein
MSRCGKWFVNAVIWCFLSLAAIWSTLAVYYSNLPVTIRPWVAAAVAMASVVILVFKYRVTLYRWVFVAAFAILLAWWFSIRPSNNRDWQPDLAVLATADIKGDQVTIHNIRNCDYRTETDFTCHYYDKTVDLSKLRHIDLFLVYWGSPSIAHTIMSFEFEGQGYVSFSIETRKEIGEAYSTIKGFFRQYEIFYVVADERDVVRLRTNYREAGKGEDVYLYRLRVPPELAHKAFLSYLDTINRLSTRPQWYNALTDNCTTSILRHTMPYNPQARFDWRFIVNGYVDEMLYERKVLDTDLPFDEFKKRSYINPIAQAADKDPRFSEVIRTVFNDRRVMTP